MNRLLENSDADKRQFEAFCKWQKMQAVSSSTSASITKIGPYDDASLKAEKGRAEYLESRLEYVNKNLRDNKVHL